MAWRSLSSETVEAMEDALRTLFDHLSERRAIVWEFGDGLAEMPRLPSPVVHGQREVVCSDRARDSWPARLDRVNGCASRRVLQDDAQARERPV